VSLSHHSVTTTWHNDSLTRDKFFYFLKKIQKIKIKLKSQKIQELTYGTSSNGVTVPLTEVTKLRPKKIKGPH